MLSKFGVLLSACDDALGADNATKLIQLERLDRTVTRTLT